METMTDSRLTTGFNRFRFGFAKPGEVFEGDGFRLVFVGDFGRKKDAHAAATDGAQIHPYLNGNRKTGWAVWRKA